MENILGLNYEFFDSNPWRFSLNAEKNQIQNHVSELLKRS